MFINWQLVDEHFMSVMGVSLQSGGRDIDGSDLSAGGPAVLVNEAFARRFLEESDPIGRRLKIVEDGEDVPWQEVVGVVSDLRQGSLERTTNPEVFIPYTRPSWVFPSMDLMVRSGMPSEALIPALREAVWDLDPDQPIRFVAPLRTRVRRTLARPRFYTALVGSFAAAALVLALVGLYGTLAHAVEQRGSELGVRMALGLSAGGVTRSVVASGLRLVLAGGVLGVILAYALSSLLEGFVFGITPTDPPTLAVVFLLVVGTGVLACTLPARRAARVDPTTVLRG